MNEVSNSARSAGPNAWSARLLGWCRRTLLVHAVPRQPGLTTAQRLAAMEAAISHLTGLNQTTAGQFQLVADKLTGLNDVARISAEMDALTTLVSGVQSNRTADSLTEALAQCREMQNQATEANKALAGIHKAAGQLGRTFSGLEQTESGFSTIATLVRVETARLGAAGSEFGNLADEVKSLAGSLKAGANSAVETARKLTASIQETIATAEQAGDRNAKDLPGLIADINRVLDSIRSGQSNAHQASLRLHGQYREVAKSVQNLAVSLQFQDITSQQVEHVIQSLTQLCSKSRSQNAHPYRLPAGARSVLALQSAQLADAERTFARSAAQVEQNLDLISAQVNKMTHESGVLAGSFESQQESYFVDLERGCTMILAAIRSCASDEERLDIAAGILRDSVVEVQAVVEGLVGIDADMHRLSRNAIIRAAHIGQTGNALEVLANAMQELSSDSARRSRAADEVLEALRSGARLLTVGSERSAGRQDTLTDDLRSSIEGLHSANEASYSRIQAVQHLGSRLLKEISATRESFTVGQLFPEVIERARALLAEASAGLDSSPEQQSEPTDEMESLESRYTMKSERDVHLAGKNGTIPVLAGSASEPEGNDAGGDVELF